MSCMRSKRVGPQHGKGLVRGVQLKGSSHRHSSQMDRQCWQQSDVQKASQLAPKCLLNEAVVKVGLKELDVQR